MVFRSQEWQKGQSLILFTVSLIFIPSGLADVSADFDQITLLRRREDIFASTEAYGNPFFQIF